MPPCLQLRVASIRRHTACRFKGLPQQQPIAAIGDYLASTEAHSESDEFNSRYPDSCISDFWLSGFFKKLRISLFARTSMETAARAGVILWFNGFAAKLGISLFARTTLKTAARAGVIFWFNGFAAKLGISLFARSALKTAARAGTSFRAATAVAPIRTFKTTAIRKDEASKEDSIHPVVPAVQDVEITVVPVVAMALVTDKASPGLISLDCLWEWNWSRRRRPWGSAGYQAMESKRFAGSWRQSSSRMDFHGMSCV